MTAVVFDHAALAYDGRVAVDADLTVETGSFVGLVGPSAAGKTTMLRAIVGQLRPVRGSVRVDGHHAGDKRVRVGYVPQLETIDWHFPITAGQVVLLGGIADSGPLPWPSRAEKARMESVLDRLGIGGLAERPLRSLSGGQQQRVFLARALIRRPHILVLDEPTAGLDVATRQDILSLLRELNDSGITVVVTTHDLNGVAATLPLVACVRGRVIAHGQPEDVFTSEILSETFGAEMLVFHHDGALLTADAGAHGAAHPHHAHLHHGPPHDATQ